MFWSFVQHGFKLLKTLGLPLFPLRNVTLSVFSIAGFFFPCCINIFLCLLNFVFVLTLHCSRADLFAVPALFEDHATCFPVPLHHLSLFSPPHQIKLALSSYSFHMPQKIIRKGYNDLLPCVTAFLPTPLCLRI